jgi:hypothetical protein
VRQLGGRQARGGGPQPAAGARVGRAPFGRPEPVGHADGAAGAGGVPVCDADGAAGAGGVSVSVCDAATRSAAGGVSVCDAAARSAAARVAVAQRADARARAIAELTASTRPQMRRLGLSAGDRLILAP